MKCPKCRKGRLYAVPPPEGSIDHDAMYYCNRMACDYMGNGALFTSPEDRREQWETFRGTAKKAGRY